MKARSVSWVLTNSRREVIIEKYHIGGFLRDVGTGDIHCNAEVSLLQRWRVVDTVSSPAGRQAGISIRVKEY